jgi:predicted RNA-binding protein YlqC (UPF0109 family)
MATKGDNGPLRKVIGSTGRRNQAIKDFFSKTLRRSKARQLQVLTPRQSLTRFGE